MLRLERAALLALLSFAFLVPSAAFAQLVPGTPYQLIRGPNTFVPLTNPTVVWPAVDDDTRGVTLPFAVKFYDTMQSSVSLEANGAIGFPSGVSVTRFNTVPGTTGTPSGFVAPMWDDLLLAAGPGNGIGYQVEGTAPSRTITFEWRNIGFYTFNGPVGEMSFQVRFYEGASGRIDIDYGPKSGTFNGSTTMGMESPADTGPILFVPRGCTDDCVFNDFPANTRVTVVQDPGVELVAVDVRPPALAFLGAQVAVPVIVQNLHGMPVGPFEVSVVAGPTADLVGAVPIGGASMSLGAFTTRTVAVDVVPPTSLGTNPVYVGVVVDPADVISEADEGNNVAVSAARMRLLQGGPDLAVQDVRISSTQVAAGDVVDVVARVQNLGGDGVSGVDVAIMLSSNTVISRQDAKLGQFSITLGPGESVTTTTSVTIDAATNTGTYYVGALADPMDTLAELSESNNGLADSNPLEVTGGPLAITTSALPSPIVGRTYAATLSARGGDPAARIWTLDSGVLPAGIGLGRTSGDFFGRPTAVEVQTFTVRVESGGEAATKTLTLAVSDPAQPLTIVTRDIPPGVVGQSYQFPIITTGGDGAELVWSATGLPPGIELGNRGVLSGTPLELGSSTFSVTVTDGTETAARELTLVVSDSPNLLIVPRRLSTARFGEAYVEQLEATGAISDVLWLLEGGTLPSGLTLSPSGEISGTPTRVGRSGFIVGARDTAVGRVAADSNAFEIEVLDDDTFEITTAMLPSAVVGEGYAAGVSAIGGLPPLTWSVREGRLPDGLLTAVDDTTGDLRIGGQPLEEGVANVIIEVVDSQGRSARRAFGIRVELAAPVVEPPAGGCSCAARGVTRAAKTSSVLLLLGLLGIRRRR